MVKIIANEKEVVLIKKNHWPLVVLLRQIKFEYHENVELFMPRIISITKSCGVWIKEFDFQCIYYQWDRTD